MQRHNLFAVKDDASGEHVASASISVFDQGTANLSSIFGDNLGTPTPKANPFTCDANGYGFFYAASGRYDVQFSGTGITTPYTVGDVLLHDPTDGPDRWENVFIPAVAMLAAGTAAVPSSGEMAALNLFGLRFDKDTDNELAFSFVLPNAYKEAGNLSVYAHWHPDDATAGDVAWELGYSWVNAGAAFAAAATLTASPTAPGVALEAVTSLLGTITGTGKNIDSVLSGYIRRDADLAGDTYAADAWLSGLSFRFLIDTVGSAAAITK